MPESSVDHFVQSLGGVRFSSDAGWILERDVAHRVSSKSKHRGMFNVPSWWPLCTYSGHDLGDNCVADVQSFRDDTESQILVSHDA